MNSKYYDLSLEKKRNLVNAGYKAFALYPYKKASMAIIANEANISKSLLFYYFKDKKEYYLYLFNLAIEFLKKEKTMTANDEKVDLFEFINNTVERRLMILHEYPYLMKFATRAYYESDESVQFDLQMKKEEMTQLGMRKILDVIDYQLFENDADAEILVNIVLYIAEGCMRGQEDLDSKKMNEMILLFQKMMLSLKNHYYSNKSREETL